jgi:TRAP-type C4-dicarboxylate transport system substrate-binding protein
VADIAFGLSGATPGRYPMTDLISEAYVTPAEGGSCAVMSRRLTSLYDQYLAAEYVGVKMLWMMVTSPLKFHTTKVALRKLEDFKGLRIRYAGEQFADIVTALGAVPLAVPPGETQDGLAKGIIDGATFPYEGAQSFDIGTVVKYSLEPGISTATFGAAMNPKRFESLPPDLAALITQSTGPAMATRFGTALDGAEGEGRAYMLAKGVTITTMPDDEMAKMRAAVAPLLAKRVAALAAQGKPAAAFHAAYVG